MRRGEMNLCVICREVDAYAAGGVVTATRALADALAEQGHEVHVITDRTRHPAALRSALLDPVTVPAASGMLRGAAPETASHNLMHAAAAYRRVKQIHERERPVDAVLAPLWRSEGAVCLLDERFPTIVTCMTSLQTLVEVDPSYRGLPDIEERLALERCALAPCRYLHGLTHTVLAKTIADLGAAPELTAVIGRGLDDRARPSQSASRNGRPPQILFVGRIERRKGVDVLLEAASQLLEEGLVFQLSLVGPNADPSIRNGFEHEATARPRLREAIQFRGPVSDEELVRLYADCDIVCLPSRSESHGVALVEAMMFGKPIVTCDAGGIPEVVEDERNALLAPADDAPAIAQLLRRLFEDAELRVKLGTRARAAFERRFDAGAVALEMRSFLERVISHHAGLETTPEAPGSRLARLMQDVFDVGGDVATRAAAELLDPADSALLHRLRTPARNAAARRKPAPQLAAIVLTQDRTELLERALDSIEASDARAETLVIDNGSALTHARRAATICAARDGVRLHRSEVNLGCVAGRRLGLELTESDPVLFLDDDAELLPGALDHLLADLDAHPGAAAVAATVISSDATVSHSGGSLERTDGVVTCELIGAGISVGSEELPPSGPAGWVPGTAALVRREFLEAFPLDLEMAAYCEDNEWCYRVSLARPESFRRCREAVVLHRLAANVPGGGPAANAHRVELLVAATHFYKRHGAILAPWTFDGVLPELRSGDGTCDATSARLLMELVAAKGAEWTLAALNAGEFDGLLSAGRLRAENERLRQAIAAQEQTMSLLYESHATLDRVVNGGWWRLRGRILPLVQLAGAARRRLRRGGERSPS